MPATAAQARNTQLGEVAQFWNAVRLWLAQNSRAAIQSALVGALFSYGLNFVMSFALFRGQFDGSQGVLGSVFRSSLFFGILSTVVFGLIGYRRAVGRERFWEAIHKAPTNIAMLFQQDGKAARVHLLWGAAISLLAMQFVSPWLGAAVAVGFLSAVPSVFGRVIAALLRQLWSSVAKSIAPTKGQRVEGSVGTLVGMIGSAVALLLGALISDPGTKFALAAICIVAAFVMRTKGPSTTIPLIVAGLAALLGQTLFDLLHPLLALALDGERPIPGEMGGLLMAGGDGMPDLSLLGVTWNSTAGLVGGGIAAPFGLGLGMVSGQFPWGGDFSFGGGGEPIVQAPPPPPPPAAAPRPVAAPPPLNFDTPGDLPAGPPPPPTWPSPASGNRVDTAEDVPQGPPAPLSFGPLGPPDGPVWTPSGNTPKSDDFPDLPNARFTRRAVLAGEDPPNDEHPQDPSEPVWRPSDGPMEAPLPFGSDDGDGEPEGFRLKGKDLSRDGAMLPTEEPLDGGNGQPHGPSLDDINKLIEENSDPAEVERLKGIAQRAAELAKQGVGSLEDIQKKMAEEFARQKERGLLPTLTDAAGEGLWQAGDTLWGVVKDIAGAVKNAITDEENVKGRTELEALKKKIIEEGRTRGEDVDDPFWLRAKLIEEGKRRGVEKMTEVVTGIPGAVKNLFTVDEKQRAELEKVRAKVTEEGRKNGDPVDDPYWVRAKMLQELKRQSAESLMNPEYIKDGLGLKEIEKGMNMPVGSTTATERLGVVLPGVAKLVGFAEGARGAGGLLASEAAAVETGQAVLDGELEAAAENPLVAKGEAVKQRIADSEAERAAQVKELTAETKKPQPVGETETPPDERYTPANLSNKELDEALAGMPKRNQEHVQMVADRYGVEIQVRPTNADARALLESGKGFPKPEGIKMKTITDLDIQLGAPSDGAAKVGYFKPEVPEGYASVEDMPKKLRERFNERTQEFIDRRADVERMKLSADPSHGEPLIEVRDGVVYDKKTGKPFCGDHDLFDIRGRKGEELPQAVIDAVNNDLHKGPALTQHGEHMGWDYGGKSTTPPPPTVDPATGETIAPRSDYDKAKGIDDKILKGHGPPVYGEDGKLKSGGEPLVTFSANEQTGPVGEKLSGSYYTGDGRPVRVTPEEKVLLERKGMTVDDLKGMSPSDAHRALERPVDGAHAPDEAASAASQDTDRTKVVQDALRKQGVKEELVQNTTYKPYAPWEVNKASGTQTVRGHVGEFELGKPTPAAEVHAPAFEELDPRTGEVVKSSDLMKERVAYHEGVTHPQQYDQLQTQAAKGGPMEHLVEQDGPNKGQLTQHDPDNPTALTGQAYLEREAHLSDLDRMLKVKQDALMRAARDPAVAEKALADAAAADKEISHARAALKGYGVPGDRPPGYTKDWQGWARPDDETLP